ncbi:MAG TPA: hypothetical protein VG142_00180 [Trebonia sp.]|jgi:hypothetical protein|nr:hypothetical protein [Trebonia sp.]
MRRRLAALAVTATAVVMGVAFSVGPAKADTVIDAVYPVSGSTYINATQSALDLGPGTLSTAIDLSAGDSITGTVALPASTGSFSALGFVPVTATVKLIPVGETTGSLVSGALTDGEVSATSKFTIQITNMVVAGLEVPPGPLCETATPATITVTSPSDFNATLGGTLTGTYTIPDFLSCGPLGVDTLAVNALIPGPGNTISLTLGTPALSAG